MEVVIEEFVATAIRDRKTKVKPRLWRIRVDGIHAGFIKRQGHGISEDAKIMFHLRYPDWEREEIEQKVSEHFQQQVESSQPSELKKTGELNTDAVLGDLE